MSGLAKTDSRSPQIQFHLSKVRFTHAMFSGEEREEDDMSGMQSKTHLRLTSPPIQMMKHHIEIDASIGSNNSLYVMCQREMQTHSLI